MEWIKISDCKLKIMLTAEDARHYALPAEASDLSDGFTREAFREILSDIRDDAGFDTREEKIYIQMYPSKDGGCELFVTKMGLLCQGEPSETSKPPPKKKKCTEVSEKKRGELQEKKTQRISEAYVFRELSDLISAAERLLYSHYTGESEAWRGEDGKYWLILSDSAEYFDRALSLHLPLFCPSRAMLAEYGKRENAEISRIFLSEHGKCIASTAAVERLGMLS